MDKEKNADHIISKAYELFIRYGIHNVSMDEIAAHIRISKKTIYQFFPSKDALVESVLDMEFANIDSLIKERREKADNAIHEILLAGTSTQEIFSRLNRCLMDDIEKYCPEGYKKIKDYNSRVIYDLIIDNIERGKLEKLYREEVAPDIIARYRIVSLLLVFNKDFLSACKQKVSYILEEITDHFLFGLVTHTGYEVIKRYKRQEKLVLHDKA